MSTTTELHNRPVRIVGMGALSAIGMNVNENFQSLKTRQHGIAYPEILQTRYARQFPCGEIRYTNKALAEKTNLPDDLPRTIYLSTLAAREALQGLPTVQEIETAGFKTGFISGNTIGGMDLTEKFYDAFRHDHSMGKLSQIRFHECGSITTYTSSVLGFKGYHTTLNTACSSSANALMLAARLIQHGVLDVVLAGGADALCRFTLNGFNTLMIVDQEPCKPFDENRKGLNLGEGAAYLVLVSDRFYEQYHHLTCYGTLSGFANANDAFHQTASSADGNGNFLAMSNALKQGNLTISDIGYINAHGTGTANNDSSEGIAIERLFGDAIPPLSSTKAYTGHTLGACGALEAVYSLLALQEGLAYPCLRIQTPMKDLKCNPLTDFAVLPQLKHVMSNSFGFGGNCSSLIFSKS